MLRTNLFVLTARSNNSGLSQQQNIVVLCLPRNLQPSLIYLKWVVRSAGLPSFAGDRSRQQDRCVAFLKLDPPPIQCAARVNSLLTEQSSYNFNSVILFSTFTRLTAYSWRRVQFETTTLAHLLASCVKRETLEPGKVSTVYTGCGLCCGCGKDSPDSL